MHSPTLIANAAATITSAIFDQRQRSPQDGVEPVDKNLSILTCTNQNFGNAKTKKRRKRLLSLSSFCKSNENDDCCNDSSKIRRKSKLPNESSIHLTDDNDNVDHPCIISLRDLCMAAPSTESSSMSGSSPFISTCCNYCCCSCLTCCSPASFTTCLPITDLQRQQHYHHPVFHHCSKVRTMCSNLSANRTTKLRSFSLPSNELLSSKSIPFSILPKSKLCISKTNLDRLPAARPTTPLIDNCTDDVQCLSSSSLSSSLFSLSLSSSSSSSSLSSSPTSSVRYSPSFFATPISSFFVCLLFLLSLFAASSRHHQVLADRNRFYHISTLCLRERVIPLYKMIDGAIITSKSENNLDCTITFQTDTVLQKFMLRFEKLALDCNDHLYIYDGAHTIGNHKAHLSCRSTRAEVGTIYTQDNFLTLHYTTDAYSKADNGFMLVITAYKDSKNHCREHRCANQFCISRDLVCDGFNHCGDNSDESYAANCPKNEPNDTIVGLDPTLFGAAVGTVFLTCLACVLSVSWCLCRREKLIQREMALQLQQQHQHQQLQLHQQQQLLQHHQLRPQHVQLQQQQTSLQQLQQQQQQLAYQQLIDTGVHLPGATPILAHNNSYNSKLDGCTMITSLDYGATRNGGLVNSFTHTTLPAAAVAGNALLQSHHGHQPGMPGTNPITGNGNSHHHNFATLPHLHHQGHNHSVPNQQQQQQQQQQHNHTSGSTGQAAHVRFGTLPVAHRGNEKLPPPYPGNGAANHVMFAGASAAGATGTNGSIPVSLVNGGPILNNGTGGNGGVGPGAAANNGTISMNIFSSANQQPTAASSQQSAQSASQTQVIYTAK